jgi:hypothetical protein
MRLIAGKPLSRMVTRAVDFFNPNSTILAVSPLNVLMFYALEISKIDVATQFSFMVDSLS